MTGSQTMSQSFLTNRRDKVVNDPIHGLFTIPSYCVELIDTPQFQRLRDLKQLGATYFVFPGASHNRFEHSLGVCHLSNLWLTRFMHYQPELGLSEKHLELCSLAGLLHDLGHGPFSHLWDREFLRRVGKKNPSLLNWSHEVMSAKMFEYMIDANSIDIEKDDIRVINALIEPPLDVSERLDVDIDIYPPRNRFIFEIVNNTISSIDVDKFDYLARDSYCLGMKTSFDYARLLNFSRVIDDHICFYAKEDFNVYELFHFRYSLFKSVYLHRVIQAIDFMLVDILLGNLVRFIVRIDFFSIVAADNYLKISESTLDCERFSHLTDHILRSIEGSREAELADSRQIISRLRTRKLYKFVDEMIFSSKSPAFARISSLTEEELITYQSAGDASLSPEDLIVSVFELNYAMKDSNPVDKVHFYSTSDPNKSFLIQKNQVSYLVPNEFSENVVRVFVRDAAKRDAARRCFRNFWEKVGNLVGVSPPLPIASSDAVANHSAIQRKRGTKRFSNMIYEDSQ